MPHLKSPTSLKDLALKSSVSLTKTLCKVAEHPTDLSYVLCLPTPFDEQIAKEALKNLCKIRKPSENEVRKFIDAFSCFFPVNPLVARPIRSLDLDIFEERRGIKFKAEARIFLKTHLKCPNFRVITSLKINELGSNVLMRLIARNCPNLEELRAGSKITDLGMEYLVGKKLSHEKNTTPGCFKLKTLDIGSWETNITPKGASLGLKFLKNLEYFGFSNFFSAFEELLKDPEVKAEFQNGHKLMIKKIEGEFDNLELEEGPLLDLFLQNICPKLESICCLDEAVVKQIAKISQIYRLRCVELDLELQDTDIRMNILDEGRFDYLSDLQINMDSFYMEDMIAIGNNCENLNSLKIDVEFSHFDVDQVKVLNDWYRNKNSMKPFAHLRRLSLKMVILTDEEEHLKAAVQIFFIRACPHLEELYLLDLREEEVDAIVSELLKGKHLQQLEKLKLASEWKQFSIEYMDGVNEEQMKELIKKLPELKEFNLTYLCGIEKEDFESLSKYVRENNFDLILT